MKTENRTSRIDPIFKEEMQKIKKARLENNIDKKKISDRMITSLIPKWEAWEDLKKAIINFNFDKRGIANQHLFLFIIAGFLALLIIGSFIYAMNTMTVALSDPALADAGAVNMTLAVEDTIGQINNAMLNQANIFSILLLFGMVFGLIFNAYMTRDEFPAVFFVIDLIIIIFAYILATYIANSFETVLGALPFASIFTNNMSFGVSFMLLLPKITVIVGAIVMVISYSAIPKSKEEEVAGF